MRDEMSSRERMLRALSNKEADHVPLCFMIYAALRRQCGSDEEFVKRQLEMGVDATVQLRLPSSGDPPDHSDLSGLPVRYHPDVETKIWKEHRPGEDHQFVLHKEYHTPVGALSTTVNQTDDWPYGDFVPFLDDYLCPRSRKFLIGSRDDLEALGYLLTPPVREDIEAFRQLSEARKEFAAEHQLLVTAGRGVGIEASAWLCGFRDIAIAALRDPEFVDELSKLIYEWNRERMRVLLGVGIDLFIRRGWYEGTDFWSPRLYRRFILPYLKREIQMAHEAGARFGYIMTSGSMPLLDMLIEADLDVLIGVDPVQGKGTDLALMKEKLAGKICIWGGVNGFVTMETGTKEKVAAEVARAVRTLGPAGGFILCPVDNVRDDSPKTRDNVQAMIETWRRIGHYPIG